MAPLICTLKGTRPTSPRFDPSYGDIVLGWIGLNTRAGDGPSEGRSQPGSKGKRKGDSAFDLWLQRGLHEMFDEIANEPVPDELRRLIEDDREP